MGYIKRLKSIRLYPDVQALPLEELYAQGVRALLIDLDGTLLPWNGMQLPRTIVSWAQRVRDAGIQGIIVSNNHPERVLPIARSLGFEALCDAGKPLPRAFRRAAHDLGVPLHACGVLGDQMMTDMLGGVYLGMRGYLVNPLPGREYVGTRINRVLERCVLRLLGHTRPGGGQRDA